MFLLGVYDLNLYVVLFAFRIHKSSRRHFPALLDLPSSITESLGVISSTPTLVKSLLSKPRCLMERATRCLVGPLLAPQGASSITSPIPWAESTDTQKHTLKRFILVMVTHAHTTSLPLTSDSQILNLPPLEGIQLRILTSHRSHSPSCRHPPRTTPRRHVDVPACASVVGPGASWRCRGTAPVPGMQGHTQ